jgi:hypothetical protein
MGAGEKRERRKKENKRMRKKKPTWPSQLVQFYSFCENGSN